MDPCFLVAVDSSEAAKKPRESQQTSDDLMDTAFLWTLQCGQRSKR